MASPRAVLFVGLAGGVFALALPAGFDSGTWVQRLSGGRLRHVASGGYGATCSFDAVEHDWQPLPRHRRAR